MRVVSYCSEEKVVDFMSDHRNHDAASMIKPDTTRYCYLDIDINHARQKLATTAAFVHATDTRYGLSSKDLRELGGSELNRLKEDLWQARLGADVRRQGASS